MTGAIMSYRWRNDVLLPAFMIAIRPEWSCSIGPMMSVAATACPNAAHPTAAPSANRSRARRSGKETDIRRFRLRDSGQGPESSCQSYHKRKQDAQKGVDDSRPG